MSLISGKIIERLSRYRSVLQDCLNHDRETIYSHELAAMVHATSAQVRQDIMKIGYNGTPSKGYVIKDLIGSITQVLDEDGGTKIALVGAGNLGKAIISYFKGKRPKLSIKAVFDIDGEKIGRMISGVRCYHLSEAREIIKESGISVAIIACPGESIDEVKDILIRARIRSILNCSSTPIKAPPNVYVEEMDITAALEKAVYYAKQSNQMKQF
ncbi:MAG: redox-sensing transcriptional repressor Rex [Clostridiales bacterium]